jgi:hypothetical protein
MEISTGKRLPRGLRAVIYGVEGIGKTTLASKLEAPLFLDLENGSFGLDVARIEDATPTWQGVLGTIEALKRDNHGYRTFVIDSADKLEALIVADYLKEKNISTLIGFGKYGDGWIETAERFCTVLDRLGDLADNGMDVVLIGHAQQRRVDLPEQTDSYDHWELNLSKRAAPRTREWPEILAFINYRMNVIPSKRDFGKVVNKADGGDRMVFTLHTPFWDAKHRAGIDMPDEFKLDDAAAILREVFGRKGNVPTGEPKQEWSEAATTVEKPVQKPVAKPAAKPTTKPPAKKPVAKSPLRQALDNYGITDDEIREYIREKKVCGNNEPWQVDDIPAKFAEWLIARMDQIAAKIKG